MVFVSFIARRLRLYGSFWKCGYINGSAKSEDTKRSLYVGQPRESRRNTRVFHLLISASQF